MAESTTSGNFLLLPFWNRQERRLRAFWRLLGVLILFVSMMVGVNIGIDLIGWQGPQAPFNLLAIVLAMWLAGRWLDRRPFADFGLHVSPRWWIDLGFGLLLGTLLMTGIFVVELLAGWVTIDGMFVVAVPGRAFTSAIVSATLVYLTVGIGEELIFRGYLLRNLSEGLRLPAVSARSAVVLAWVISSLLFGLGHAANPNATFISTANITLAGIFLGVGYVLTGELAIPIGVHITWNFFQGNVFGFPVSGSLTSYGTFIAVEQGGPVLWTGGAFGPEAGLIGIIAIVLGTLLTWLWVRWTHQRATVDADLAHYRRTVPSEPVEQEQLPTLTERVALQHRSISDDTAETTCSESNG